MLIPVVDSNKATVTCVGFEDQPALYFYLAGLLKKSPLYKTHKGLIDEMSSIFKNLKVTGGPRKLLVWQKMPIEFLNIHEVSIFKNRFYFENDVNKEKIHNRISDLYALKLDDYEEGVDIKKGRTIELALAIQLGLINYSPGDCIRVKEKLYFSLSDKSEKSPFSHWRIHNGRQPEMHKKFRVQRIEL